MPIHTEDKLHRVKDGVFEKYLSLIAFVAAFCFFVTAVTTCGYHRFFAPGAGNPAIVCKNPVVNLGQLSGEGTFPCEFLISNAGNRDLTIQDVKPGCGDCVKIVGFPTKPIPPSHSEFIRVVLQPKTLNGTVTRSISVRSNDPQQTWLVLRIKATVESPLPEAKETVNNSG